MFVSTKTTFGLIVSTATAHEMDACLGLDVQASEDGSCTPRYKWWHWISLKANFEEDLNGVPLVNYADSQSKMEQGKARLDVVEAVARALAEVVAKFSFL
jgi:hypothetical protein